MPILILLRAALSLGVAVVVITESLSWFSALKPLPVACVWIVLTLAAMAKIERPRVRAVSSFSWFCVLSIGTVAALIAVVAIASPPNSTDAMGYHLPRVLFWAQNSSVRFFPTNYLNQIMLAPLAEYFILQTWILSGGDVYANLVQFFGYVGSVVAVSLIARELGASERGQALAALVCATTPNAILQASGVKNDCLLALWLAAMTAFALRWTRTGSRWDLAAWTAALSLALLTKGTAYFFAPPLLLAVLLTRKHRNWVEAAGASLLAIVLLNGPQYARNFGLSGSVLGFDSAQGDGQFRWANDRFGPGVTFSNLLRSASEHFAGRSEAWNQHVYQAVVHAHEAFGLDVNDAATTWKWTRFEPPRNANHEANSPNRWQLLLIALSTVPLVWKRNRPAIFLFAGLVAAMVLFSAVLRWQPYTVRFELPLFVIGSALVGVAWVPVLPRWSHWLLALFLLNAARPFVFENWVRPLRGPNSVLRTSRETNYFSDMKTYGNRGSYEGAVKRTIESGCMLVGVDSSRFQLEYPYEALLRARNRQIRFLHTDVQNASARYGGVAQPCAVLCLNCAGVPEKLRAYSDFKTESFGQFLLFLR